MKKRSIVTPIVIGGLCMLVIVAGVYLYAKQFPVRYSNRQEDWGAFGDYLGLFLNAVSVILLTWIGLVTFQTTDSFNRVQLTPLLDFAVNRPSKHPDKVNDSWYLINASSSAARNIRLKYFIGGKFESAWVACYSLNGNSNLEVPWIQYADRIVAVYSDALEQAFFKCEYSQLIGKLTRIKREEYEAILSAINTKNYINLVNDFYNHVDINIKENGHNGIVNSDDYIKFFLKHHKLNVEAI